MQKYNQTINGKPTIASNGNTKLVGTTGNPGTIKYFSDLAVVSTDTGYTSLGQITWNDNTQVIGGSGKFDYGPANIHSNYYKGYVTPYAPTDIIDGTDTDITDAVHNNRTITLTNVAHDGYGINYDLKLSFTNTDSVTQRGAWQPSKVVIGRAPDDSIEFDYYGGFQTNSDNTIRTDTNAGLNISNIEFVYHGTDVAAPVFINTLVGDIDAHQMFTTNLGNQLSWTPSGSNVSINGSSISSDGEQYGFNGFKSAPQGTALLVGAGTSFNYHFRTQSAKQATKDELDQAGDGGQEGGVQFNLFGKGASLSQSPTPPIRQTTTAHYHYDTNL